MEKSVVLALAEALAITGESMAFCARTCNLAAVSSAADDCVRILTENGSQFTEPETKVRKMPESLDAKTIALLRQYRMATGQVWQWLAAHSPLARNRRYGPKVERSELGRPMSRITTAQMRNRLQSFLVSWFVDDECSREAAHCSGHSSRSKRIEGYSAKEHSHTWGKAVARVYGERCSQYNPPFQSVAEHG